MPSDTRKLEKQRIAIIGMGASSLYLLKNLLERANVLSPMVGTLVIVERGSHPGVGMPYNPETTDKHNICNISSEELPPLQCSFADWLRAASDETLSRHRIARETISDSETYPRLALGEYFEAQFYELVAALRVQKMTVELRLRASVTDLRDDPEQRCVWLTMNNRDEAFDRVVIATGHAFPPADEPANGYYASPWPMQKLLPADGTVHNFTIGTLGASLSAFDVVSSLAHRHGEFIREGDRVAFVALPQAKQFRIVMHSSNGWLPHLQYDQCKTFREVYRAISREGLLALRDGNGLLRLDRYFDHVCRPALASAFSKDNRQDISIKLQDKAYTLEDFVNELSEEHAYDDAFEGLKQEYPQARRSVRHGKPVHWKETLDDVMYTLSYHGDLMPAEDHLRLKKVVMPFLMNVIAALPLRSADILLALHESGHLDLHAGRLTVTSKAHGQTEVEIDSEGAEETLRYRMFIDCSGQPAVEPETYPFARLVEDGSVRQARARFAEADSAAQMCKERGDCVIESDGPRYVLPGIDIDGAYRVIGEDGVANPRIFDIAFPHTSGLRPYSYGLQACNHTAGIVVEAWRDEFSRGRAPSSNAAQLTKLHDKVANEQ